MLVPVRTLLQVKRKFGEEGERISYLKVDVEGSEIKAGLSDNASCQNSGEGWIN